MWIPLVPSDEIVQGESHLASRKQFTPMFGALHQKHLDLISYGSGMTWSPNTASGFGSCSAPSLIMARAPQILPVNAA